MADHTNASQQRFDSEHSQLAHALKAWWKVILLSCYDRSFLSLSKVSFTIYRKSLILPLQLLKP